MAQLLMCSPDLFGVDYVINPWMEDQIGNVNSDKALSQWTDLYNALSRVAVVRLIDPVPGLPDMVFTANAGLVVNNKFFLSRFAHSQRQKEEKYFREWFLKNGWNVIEQGKHNFEGEGDCLRDKEYPYQYISHGFRTRQEFHGVLSSFDIDNMPLKLVDPRFYHLDTCFCPLNNGEVLYYPEAFDENSRKFITNNFDTAVDVTEEEALTFCCNAVVVGENIFMPKCKPVANILRNTLNYTVHEFDMSEFMKSGGACKCLVLHLD